MKKKKGVALLSTETVTRYNFTDITCADMMTIGMIAAKKIDETTLGNDAISCMLDLAQSDVIFAVHTAQETYDSHPFVSLGLNGDTDEEMFIELHDDGILLFYDNRIPGALFDVEIDIANIQAELESFGIL